MVLFFFILFIILLYPHSLHSDGDPTTHLSPYSVDGDPDDDFLVPGMKCHEALSNWGNARDEEVPVVSANNCEVSLAGFKSWKEGVVTTLSPRINRNCSKLFVGRRF